MNNQEKCTGCGTTANHHGADCPIHGWWESARPGINSAKPYCCSCGQRKAVWPKHAPRFCTQRCAATWAFEMNEGMVWLQVDGEYDWHDRHSRVALEALRGEA